MAIHFMCRPQWTREQIVAGTTTVSAARVFTFIAVIVDSLGSHTFSSSRLTFCLILTLLFQWHSDNFQVELYQSTQERRKKMRASIYWMQCTWLCLPKHSKQSTKHVIKYCCVVLLAQRMGENWPEQNSNNMKITKLIVWRVFHEWSIISYHRTQNFWCVLCVLFFFGLPHLRIRALCVQMNEMNGK